MSVERIRQTAPKVVPAMDDRTGSDRCVEVDLDMAARRRKYSVSEMHLIPARK